MQRHQFISNKKSIRKKREMKSKPSQKFVCLKLNMPNLFLMYSSLMMSGITSNQNKSKEVQEKPKLPKPPAHTFHSL